MTTGSVLAQFTITLSQAVSEQVAVEWHTEDGTAQAGVDYAPAKGTVLFAPGQTAKTVDILVHGRAVGSEDRSFFVEMLPPTNAILGASIGECIIHVDTTGSTPVTQIIAPTGPQGLQGDSAYQTWLDLGNTGTEQDFLDSLKPSAEEIAEEVAPLLDVGSSTLTAEGTETLSKPDTMTVKRLARRVAYVGSAKVATAELAAGDNLITHAALSGDAVDFNSISLYPRILRGTVVISPEWSAEPDNKILIKDAMAGDLLHVCQYDIISGRAVKNVVEPMIAPAAAQAIESLRRSYAKAGFNVVGTFRAGFTIINANDIGIDEATGKGFSGPAGTVAADTNPITGGFTDVSNSIAAAAGGPLAFSTVDDMKNLRPLGLPNGILAAAISNLMARTISYHPGWAAMIDPVGGATYTLTTLAAVRAVRGAGWVPDWYVDHYLAAGDGATYVAVILTGDSISIEQAGAVPYDPLLDVANYNSIQAALNWANSSYGKARQVTAGVGDFYYSKTLIIDTLQPNFGLSPGIIGAGWNRTNLIKTTNTPADGAADYSVDAYVAYKTRSQTQTLYCYSSQLKHMTFKSTAAARHAYGVYGKMISHMDWKEFEVQSAQIGVYSFDAWLISWDGVRANFCDLGFKVGGTGTTLGWKNVWAHNCKDGGYDITGVVYAEWSNCAADHIYDPDNPTVNKVAYKFKGCQGIHLSGCGTENVSEAITLDNSIVKVTSFRVNSIRAGAAGQTLIRAINGSGGSFDTCGFTSVPATKNIAVQSRDATSHLSFANCAFQIANSAVPNDSAHRRNGLASTMPLDVMGLKTMRVAMNGVTWRSITALKPGCGFQLISGVAESADRYIVLSKPFWAYSEISTNPSSPTTIGYLADAAGANQTSLRAYRATDSYGVEMLYFNFSGSVSVTILFSLQTAQNW